MKNLTFRLVLAAAILGILSLACFGQACFGQTRRDQGSGARTVQGIVSDANNNAVAGAIVKLKNTKTLQIISFITKEQGDYYFHGLSPDVDFELQAEQGDRASATRTLTSFDSRKQAVINLKLDKKR